MTGLGFPHIRHGSKPEETGERELFVRHAKRDGRSVVRLRAVERAGTCVVEAEVFPPGGAEPVRRGPYQFGDAAQATAFVTAAVESLLYLDCDVYAA